MVDVLTAWSATAASQCKVIVVDPYVRGGCSSLMTGLQQAMDSSTFSFTSKDQKRPPASGTISTPIEVVLRATYARQPDPPAMESLCIVAVLGSDTGSCEDPAEAARSTSVAVPGGISIQARVAAPRPGEPAARDWPMSIAAPQLQEVALTAARIARELGVVPPLTKPGANTDELYRRLLAIYQIDSSGWPTPRVVLGPVSPGSTHYQLTISNLRMVEGSAVMLDQGKDLSVAAASQPVVDRLVRKASCELDREFGSQLAGLIGTIPTNDGAWAVARRIGMSRDVTGTVVPSLTVRAAGRAYAACPAGDLAAQTATENFRLDFTGSHRWVIGSINGSTTGAISAGSHELIGGQGQLTSTHVLSRFETISLTAKGGPEVQMADFTLSLDAGAGGWSYGFVLDTDFLRDGNQRYGALTGAKFVEEAWGPAPKLFAEYRRGAKEHGFSLSARADAKYQFRHVMVKGFPARGWVNGWNPSVSLLPGYDFSGGTRAGGVGQVFVSLNVDALAARRSAGGEFDFSRYSARGQVEAFWGVTSRSDFVVRYGRGFMTSSAGTPLFELPELGGSTNIRGIEEGEYVGRAFGFEQSEIAVNAQSVWRWVHRRESSPVAKKPSALSGLGIDGVYIGGLYDRARIGGDLFDLRHGVHGSGVKTEVRGLRAGNKRLNLSFVYARSAASILHRSGTFSTAVTIDF